jgi:hypothetical protein
MILYFTFCLYSAYPGSSRVSKSSSSFSRTMIITG